MRANVLAVLALLVALAGGALAASGLGASGGAIHACVDGKGHVKIAKKCGKKQTAVAWSRRGPTGARGDKGQRGDSGLDGASATSFSKSLHAGEAQPVASLGILNVNGVCSTSGVSYVIVPGGPVGVSYSGTEVDDDVFKPLRNSLFAYSSGTATQNLEVNLIARAGSESKWNQFVLGAAQHPVSKDCRFWGFILPSL
ncbi:MAG: hypothetical protein QOK25_2479 [Thermoleophilaceae bacterium]|jgi:hypothetical protein|nr:hypothetical protein [Thermoleophilaceae bacterium]